MKRALLAGLLAAFTAVGVLCFELPADMEDGSYVIKFDDSDSIMSISTRAEFLLEQAELAANATVAGTEEDYDEPVEAERERSVEKCKHHHISPKADALLAFERLKDNCVADQYPHKPGHRDHHVAILEKAGDAVAYMCHWGSKHAGNQCMLDELAEVLVMTPCKEGTRLEPGGNGGEAFVVAARKDFSISQRGYGYDISWARHLCRHHG